ncbi:helicase-related protein [Marinococcus luteus]|uniref:helicase-related protein n=1 Tax=Marinococcus luteus TaxID=1122204 RepID=UPI002ACD0944|nr:helicase-related protein [Marinococcus luteus]MDZ5781889.1 helicase-related protein [Marinococcus luteus]
MSEELQKSLNDRKNIVQAVKQEIVGPSDIKNTEKSLEKVKNLTFTTFEDLNSNYYWKKAGLKEEIIQKEEPSRRYAAGMLYPMEPKNSDLNEEELMIDIVNNENITGFYDDKQYDNEEIEENSGLDDLALKLKQKDSLPSSMGLTFCIARNTKNLQIKFKGGLYEKHKIRAEIFNHGENSIEEKEYNYEQQWWWRTSIFAEEDIELSKFCIGNNSSEEQIPLSVFDNNKKKIENVKLNMHIQCRTNEQYLLLTVTVINVTKPQGNFNLNEHTVFQSNINISAKPGSFLNYPKAFERNLDLTKDEWNNELLYKNKINYAFGHNCSVTWDQNSEIVSEINSTFIPSYETESMTPDVTVKIGEEEINLKVEMQALMNVESYKDLLEILQPLILGYEGWISERRNEVQNLQKELKEAAETNLKLCEDNLIRIKRGVELLKKPKVFRAFKLANEAILLQQINGKTSREAYYEKNNNGLELKIKEKSPESITKMKDLNSCNNSWRVFQLAFFLLSIQSIVDKDSDDRDIVDLIWFPTGGGKTEAYLGVAAFQMFYRRLLDPNDVGVDIIMRYTLRLLTADQFQRASRLICAMEYVRRKYEKELGSDQYSIGIWVGAKTSPNTNKEAFKKYEAMSKSKGPENLVVTRCPWCGCEIGKIEVKGSKNTESKIIGFKKINDNHLIVACPDKECDFHDELPVYFVDETIYKKQPTFLIGTIDKFVQLTWKPEARKLFGLNERGERFVSPPQIIVQDELHLISGPLGTMAGLYEVLIEELCIDDRGQKPVKPKIISATATIKEYEEQVKCLFGRTKASLFPTPGIDIDDSFFSKVAVDNNEKPMPGREYIGVFTSRVGVLMAQVMTYSAILQKTEMLPEERKDPFWTLLSFYNSLRDLGAGLSLFNSDIPTYIDSLIKREGLKNRRFLGAPLELTSRKQSNEISKTIDDLNVPYSVKDNKKRTKALNSCLASNIIEVGVDIDRLSLMGIIGQPKMTAQYIQVSGRVGRRPQERPGLIVTIYSNQNSRDKSHFEHFNEYHQRLYGQVETTSLTPFSTAALERGLTAVIIGFFRQRMDMQIANSPNNKEIRRAINDRRFKAFSNRFKNRVELIDSSQLEVFKTHFKTFMDGILKGRYEVWRVSDTERGLMYQAGNLSDGEKYPGSIPVINSLRSVDAESLGSIILIENDEKDLFQWGEDD